jgi:hypothetical protein
MVEYMLIIVIINMLILYDWFAGQNVNTYVFDYTKTIDFRNFMIFDENNLLDNNAIISSEFYNN